MRNSVLLFNCVMIAVALLFFASCKKYNEDPFISVRSPSARLVGDWKIKDYQFNGSDVIGTINSKTQTFDIRNLTIHITKGDGRVRQHYSFEPYNYLQENGHDDPLDNNDTKFFFTRSSGASSAYGDSVFNYVFIAPLSFKLGNYARWDIRNLYLNKLHLELKTDSGNYEIHLEK